MRFVNAITAAVMGNREKKARFTTLMEAEDNGDILNLHKDRKIVLETEVGPVTFKADFTYKMPKTGFRLSLGNVKNVVEWCRGMESPTAKHMVVEVGRKTRSRKNYPAMKQLMADNGYVLMEV